MKKIIALLTSALYLYGSTLCLCYMMVTGETHQAVQSQPAAHHADGHCGPQAGQTDDTESTSHEQGSSDACCIKFLQDTPSLVAAVSSPKGDVDNWQYLLTASLADLYIWQPYTFYRIHGPPGPTLRTPFLSSLRSRAPPAA